MCGNDGREKTGAITLGDVVASIYDTKMRPDTFVCKL